MSETKYTPWVIERAEFCRPHIGSRWYYGNFALGVTIDGHPRFYNVCFCFLFFDFCIAWKREAILH